MLFFFPIFSVTTDVQKPLVFVNLNSVTVQCTFLPESTSRGCHVEISGLSSSTTLRFKLERRGDSALHEHVVHGGIRRNVELSAIVFDLKSDGTIGHLPIPAAVINTTETTEGRVCMQFRTYLITFLLSAASNEDGTLDKWDLAIIIASSGTAVVVVLLLIALVVCCVIVHRRRTKAHSRYATA